MVFALPLVLTSLLIGGCRSPVPFRGHPDPYAPVPGLGAPEPYIRPRPSPPVIDQRGGLPVPYRTGGPGPPP